MTEDPEEYSEKEQWDDDLDVEPLNYVKAKVQKPILEKAEFDQKKKPLWIPILLIALLILIGSIFLFVYKGSIFNSQKEKLSQKTNISTDSSQYKTNKNAREQEIQIIEDEALTNEYVEDTLMIEDAQETILNEMELEIEEGPKNFHIVIGSFEQERNAYSFASDRESLSEDLTVIEHKGWYRVSHSTYVDSTEAKIALDNLRNSLNILAWIAYMK